MNQHVVLSRTGFSYAQSQQLKPLLRQCAADFSGPGSRSDAKVRFNFLGNYYTEYYPVAFSSEPSLLPAVVKLVGRELSFVSEEEFFAHYAPPQVRIGSIAKTSLANVPHRSGALVFEPLGDFSCARFVAWRLLTRLFQYSNPYSPMRAVVNAGLCYDCEALFDDASLSLRLSFAFRRFTELDVLLECLLGVLRSKSWIEQSIAGAQAGMLLNLRMQPLMYRAASIIPYRLLNPECTWGMLMGEIARVTAESAIEELYGAGFEAEFV